MPASSASDNWLIRRVARQRRSKVPQYALDVVLEPGASRTLADFIPFNPSQAIRYNVDVAREACARPERFFKAVIQRQM